ncbi:hypothetical protein QSJ18_10045 [Gordonia sp. ABSL1-1]|uniref:hypothetical protein n=1 Tax=Gordonia sp. ABSL1-1 TaxID=3053923 RepID=UPI0025730F84|nr:hypothetical protein [Gordonia sp. ABSL1-1]MDL9937082.1 hypothetical protein [Gordonia sp. ABSL1-1]
MPEDVRVRAVTRPEILVVVARRAPAREPGAIRTIHLDAGPKTHPGESQKTSTTQTGPAQTSIAPT